MDTKESLFKLKSPFEPAGSQPQAIDELAGARPSCSVLVGVTGSGKTFTLANVIARQHNPVLILSPNKTLAAQLYEEFSLFFPENKVCYFVSYYDYYQPESYLPAQDMYIPKETKINPELDRLRVETTASIINRRDVIVIASVSAIYSLGNPSDYRELAYSLKIGDSVSRKKLIERLVAIQYRRNDVEIAPGFFRVQGGAVTINLPYLRDLLRIELFGDVVESIELVDRREGKVLSSLDNFLIFPAKHFVTTDDKKNQAIDHIARDLAQEAPRLSNPIYRERLLTRVSHDLDMLRETGYCTGIENYSRFFDGRQPGEAPYTLFDFFDDDFLLIIDESHVALPQLRGMYTGDRARKKSLIEYGFRLEGSYDNRPLKFEEIERYFRDVIFVSATPGAYELEHSKNIVEQIVRPTGVVDPSIEVVPREGQLDHLIGEIHEAVARGHRVLITVLTKKAAEDLAQYLEKKQIKICYMHSDIKTPQRTELLHKLRLGVFDCLVGINLLREGLDLPEVGLVAILDADIEGFLRNSRSLIQTIGRAARNAQGRVILYADTITESMRQAIEETNRRRDAQMQFNREHGIVPVTVQRDVTKSISQLQKNIMEASKISARLNKKNAEPQTVGEALPIIASWEQEMHRAAERFDFEQAIELRDKVILLKKKFKIS